MWNSNKFAAMAIAGFGLAAAMATPASAQWMGAYGTSYGSVGCGSYYGAAYDVSSLGCGDYYGYAGGITGNYAPTYGYAGAYGCGGAYGYGGAYGAVGYAPPPTFSYGWPYQIYLGSDYGYSGALGYAGYGYGSGYGLGYGTGYGLGYGSGLGYGTGYGLGYGSAYGYGCGRRHHRVQRSSYVTASRLAPVRSHVAAVRRHNVAQKAARTNFALAD